MEDVFVGRVNTINTIISKINTVEFYTVTVTLPGIPYIYIDIVHPITASFADKPTRELVFIANMQYI